MTNRTVYLELKETMKKGKKNKVTKTQVGLEKETRERIRKFGKMNQTYDDALNMILDFWEVNHPNWDSKLINKNMVFLGPRETDTIIDSIKKREIVILEVDGKMVLIRMRVKKGE